MCRPCRRCSKRPITRATSIPGCKTTSSSRVCSAFAPSSDATGPAGWEDSDMGATVLDSLTASFVTAFQSVTQTLGKFSIPLLALLSVINFYWQYKHVMLSQTPLTGDALEAALLIILQCGLAMW